MGIYRLRGGNLLINGVAFLGFPASTFPVFSLYCGFDFDFF
jgi:hypothetical protein